VAYVNHPSKECLAKRHHFHLDIMFDDWFNSDKSENGHPTASWLTFKPKDEENDGRIRVFAKREFVLGEVVGIFFGQRLKLGQKVQNMHMKANMGYTIPVEVSLTPEAHHITWECTF
jgi:hypothetical protein